MSQQKSKLKSTLLILIQSLMVLVVAAICASISSALVTIDVIKAESAYVVFLILAISSTAVMAALKIRFEKNT